MKYPVAQHLEGYQEFTEKIARFMVHARLTLNVAAGD